MENKKFKATFEFELTDKGIELATEVNFKVLSSNAEKIGQILAADLFSFLTGERVAESTFQAENIIVSEIYTKDNKHKFDINSEKCQKCKFFYKCIQQHN
ncbi:hypothetical protein [Fusobacterium varium]|uniref:hypothetical protein n=1 Tax=Fusobacterium varium TaxID=856 RepID=UPI0024308AF0|nr:hypothetical protein [Fusobacterium varium]MCF0171662.1 hypothetical protein [Fusobacterium varium]